MATEIERKFLLASDAWRDAADAGVLMMQGYLADEERCTVRVRVAGDEAWLTLKGATTGVARDEYEYRVPAADGRAMLAQLARPPLIEKRRHLLRHGDHVWEIDVFAGDNAGLTVAEIELHDANEAFARPLWLGAEVSEDPRYRNSNLARHPFKSW